MINISTKLMRSAKGDGRRVRFRERLGACSLTNAVLEG